MSTVGGAAAAAVASAGVKRIVDDLYAKAKDLGVNYLGRTRSDVKEASIARAIAAVTKVKTLWNVEKEVSLYEFYYPSSVLFAEGARKRIGSLKELGIRQHFVIQGTAGQGKSIFLRYLAGQELTLAASSSRVPIFVELRRLRADLNLDALILEALQKFKLPHTASAWSYLAASGKFVLLLDAFDEIDPALAGRAVADIETLCDLHGDSLQIVITSRPDADIQRSSRFRVCRLAPLRPEDHLPFLKKICHEKGQAEGLHEVLSRSSLEIKDLLTTPLMMTLLVILYKSMQTVPDTVPRFYEELFDVLFYRHDHSKPGFRRKRYTNLDDSTIKKIFAAFCFYVRLQGLGVLTNAQFADAVKRACKASDEAVDPEKFKDELMKTVCLMQQDGFEYSFIHKSVAQYYAASFVRGSSDAFAEKFYTLAAKPDQVWDLELRFLEQIDTYRYTKLYRLPQLNSVASAIGYSFDGRFAGAVERLNTYLATNIQIALPDVGDDDDQRKHVYWLSPAKDVVVSEMAHLWVVELLDLLRTSPELGNALRTAGGVQVRGAREHEILPHLALIKKLSPDLGLRSLERLQKTHDAAVRIIATEQEKTAALAALLL